MDDIDDMRAVDALRRAMPRNTLVLDVCDRLEARIKAKPVANHANAAPANSANGTKPKRDRRAYQRELMRKRRAAAKQQSA